jgi:hypothetical protein
VKKNRSTKAAGRPKGWIFGAKWSGLPVEARTVSVTVGMAPKNWWCHGMEGQIRKAIEVKMEGQTVYVDNEDGWALSVFLRGLAPLPKFRFIPVFFVKDDPESEIFYKARSA